MFPYLKKNIIIASLQRQEGKQAILSSQEDKQSIPA